MKTHNAIKFWHTCNRILKERISAASPRIGQHGSVAGDIIQRFDICYQRINVMHYGKEQWIRKTKQEQDKVKMK